MDRVYYTYMCEMWQFIFVVQKTLFISLHAIPIPYSMKIVCVRYVPRTTYIHIIRVYGPDICLYEIFLIWYVCVAYVAWYSVCTLDIHPLFLIWREHMCQVCGIIQSISYMRNVWVISSILRAISQIWYISDMKAQSGRSQARNIKIEICTIGKKTTEYYIHNVIYWWII